MGRSFDGEAYTSVRFRLLRRVTEASQQFRSSLVTLDPGVNTVEPVVDLSPRTPVRHVAGRRTSKGRSGILEASGSDSESSRCQHPSYSPFAIRFTCWPLAVRSSGSPSTSLGGSCASTEVAFSYLSAASRRPHLARPDNRATVRHRAPPFESPRLTRGVMSNWNHRLPRRASTH